MNITAKACTLLLMASLGCARCEVTLPDILSDHAVLQKSARTTVWGGADPGEKITVTLGGAVATTVTGSDGKWTAALDLSASEPGPFEMQVDGRSHLVIHDVVVGEVWLCSGQSNMEFKLAQSADAAAEIPASSNPQLRQFLVKRHASADPVETCRGSWTVAGPVTSGQFTAVGYYFGKTLQKALGRPVGLINSSWGGTPIEAWMSPDAFASSPDLEKGKEKALADLASFPARQSAFAAQFRDWSAAQSREDKPDDAASHAGVTVDDSAWTSVTLPALFSKVGLPPGGVVWLRKKIIVPAAAANQDLQFQLGVCGGFDAFYWNGELIGETSPDKGGSVDGRFYRVPARLVKAGPAVIAMRIYSPFDNGGVDISNNSFLAGPIPLSGPWLAKVACQLPALTPAQAATQPRPPNRPPAQNCLPTYLFNGMIQPLAPCTLQGVLWYQGEHNVPTAFQYREELPAMIQSWRKLWNTTLPFCICQLPNFLAKKNVPEESPWPEMRESQAEALALPSTSMAVLIDVGEQGTIHPRNKKTPGERLAALALAGTYGRQVPFSGPVYRSMTIEGDKVRLRFAHSEGGLVAKPLPATYEKKSDIPSTAPLIRNSPDSELEGFSICGPDKIWKWASAKISGDSVLVWSSQVPNPVAVRYAWAANPTCNLSNASGLPAAPFRTDHFPLVTQSLKF